MGLAGEIAGAIRRGAYRLVFGLNQLANAAALVALIALIPLVLTLVEPSLRGEFPMVPTGTEQIRTTTLYAAVGLILIVVLEGVSEMLAGLLKQPR